MKHKSEHITILTKNYLSIIHHIPCDKSPHSLFLLIRPFRSWTLQLNSHPSSSDTLCYNHTALHKIPWICHALSLLSPFYKLFILPGMLLLSPHFLSLYHLLFILWSSKNISGPSLLHYGLDVLPLCSHNSLYFITILSTLQCAYLHPIQISFLSAGRAYWPMVLF